MTTLEALTVWRAAGRGAAAALLAAIWDQPLGRSDVTPMALPEAVTLGRRIAAALDADDAFAAVPSLDGAPAETGALAREAEHPLVAAALAERGNTVGVRLVARLMDLARLSQRLLELAQGGGGASWMRAVGVRPGAGIAAVETARGVLIHAITLDGDRIARWRIVAPTEWNFHPDGAFTRGLIGWEAQDEDAVKRAAKLLAHALDPCVAFEVSVNHA